MVLKDYVKEMQPAIECELKNVVDRWVGEGYGPLASMLRYHLGWEGDGAGLDAQGKRIRPLLVLLSAAASGADWRTALPAAAAVELIHNFSLIHDDIQDNSPLRRGRSTVWVKWGVAQAINAGDLMFTLAFLSLQNLRQPVPAETVLQATAALHETCVELTKGQYLDLFNEDASSLPLDAYWPMVSGKTAALLSCSCRLGALVAGASPERQQSLAAFGHNLGLAFQVQDDWLGIWGDAGQIGKSTESDLVSGKKTLPVLYALSLGGEFAARWQAGPVAAQDVPWLARRLEEEGARQYTEQLSDRLTVDALAALQAGASAGQPGQVLSELAHALLRRQN